jgi:8-oxo-dGTP diphosphatase
MQEYVLGYAFTNDKKNMAVVLKSKPKWQAGRFNAIGGKIENNELPYTAMIREFKEETGVFIDKWRKFCVLGDNNNAFFKLHCYVTMVESLDNLRTMEEEQIMVFPVDKLLSMDDTQIIPNLKWLIPMALDKDDLYANIIEKTDFT